MQCSVKNLRNQSRQPTVAVIKESECIGCSKCIPACPVDAIIGSSKFMHTVITHECIGCGLCVSPCPVDCIEMVAVPAYTYDKKVTRLRSKARQERLLKENYNSEIAQGNKETKQQYILAALQRRQNKLNQT